MIMDHPLKNTVCVLVAILIASSLCQSQTIDFKCESEPRISLAQYDEICREITAIDGNDNSTLDSIHEDVATRIQTCTCFLVNKRVHWAAMRTPDVKTLAAIVKNSLYRLRSNYDFLLSAYDRLILHPDSYEAGSIRSGGRSALAVCPKLKKGFSVYRRQILNLAHASGNPEFSTMIASQDESLTQLMLASYACHGCAGIDMSPTPELYQVYRRDVLSSSVRGDNHFVDDDLFIVK